MVHLRETMGSFWATPLNSVNCTIVQFAVVKKNLYTIEPKWQVVEKRAYIDLWLDVREVWNFGRFVPKHIMWHNRVLWSCGKIFAVSGYIKKPRLCGWKLFVWRVRRWTICYSTWYYDHRIFFWLVVAGLPRNLQFFCSIMSSKLF